MGVKSTLLLELNFKENEKVKVSPIGGVAGLDGRGYFIDKAIVEYQKNNKLDIPLDINHSFGEAVGWFSWESFEAREDGIYASLELNQKGKELIESKAWKYLSPVYDMSSYKDVKGIDSIALVNRPNLLNNPLNNKQEGEESKMNEEEKKAFKALEDKNAELELKIKEFTDEKEANSKALANDKLEREAFAKRIEEANEKFKVFEKMNLQPNSKDFVTSEEGLRVAKLLGLSEDEFKKGAN